MRMMGEVPEDALRQHQASMLDAVSLRDLPRNEIYEMQDGTSVVRHDLRYANFFREVCLEQQDLLEELASSEENYFIVRREAKRTKKKYLAKVDQLCYLLKKRLDRPDSDTRTPNPISIPARAFSRSGEPEGRHAKHSIPAAMALALGR